MTEPRKIVLILGNGFDLDLGLKTSYKDFWESKYCPKDYPAPLIWHLNETLGDHLDMVRWYDLEEELYRYYQKITNTPHNYDLVTEAEHRFLNEYNPQNKLFNDYPRYESEIVSLRDKGLLSIDSTWGLFLHIPYIDDLRHDAVWRDKEAFRLIKDGLCKYISSIFTEEEKAHSVSKDVLTAVLSAKDNGDFVSIYSFNYTPINISARRYGDSFHHVHGDCQKENIIIGSGDNARLDEKYDFLFKAFDKNFNPPALTKDLREASDIIIFGHSLGENDRQYFSGFFKRQASDENVSPKTIYLFTLDDESEVTIKRSLQQITDYNLSSLYSNDHPVVIKTGQLKECSSSYGDFLRRYITDPDELERCIMWWQND